MSNFTSLAARLCPPQFDPGTFAPRLKETRSSGRLVVPAALATALLTAFTAAGCHHDSTATSGAHTTGGSTAGTTGTPNGTAQGARQAPGAKVAVRGIYATGWSAGLPKKLDNLIAVIHNSGLNSMVIDVKDSDGAVSYYTPNVPLAVEIGACSKTPANNRCRDIDSVLKKCKAAHIHTIARIVCFNDPILAKKRTELAIKSSAGGIWRNRHGPWVDPTRQVVWQYNIDLAVDAIKRGFDEIQWDYVRFPSEGDLHSTVYSQPTTNGRASEIIATFLDHAYTALKQYGVPISADIFGLTGTSKTDMGIGQKIKAIADHVDYISPMVYPSHFAHGEYHLPNPNAEPYKTILYSLRDSKKRLTDFHTGIRPWLQSFSLGSPPYGPSQIIEQVKGVRDNHLSQFLFWSANNKYEMVEAAFKSQKGKQLLADMEQYSDQQANEAQAGSISPGAGSGSAPAAPPAPSAPQGDSSGSQPSSQ